MNAARKYVDCDAYLDRSLEFAERMVAHYAAGGSPRSRSRSGDRGTERNPTRLAQGKIGECAAALVLGLDPARAIRWDVGHADSGWDLALKRGTLADVKASAPPHKLIWSRDVNDLYGHKRFDVLISVSVDPENFSRCWVEGWESKANFLRQKIVADGQNSALEPGTWWMDKADLSPIGNLPFFDAFVDMLKEADDLRKLADDDDDYMLKYMREVLN
jgi:hypothetical protein